MRTVLLSGSGLSAESGLPTFRGADGLHAGIPAETLLAARTWRTQPDRIHAVHDDWRRRMAAAMPNDAHRGLAAYQQAHADTWHFTQNIDDLAERAGGTAVHLHGSIFQLRCLGFAHVTTIGAERPADDRCAHPQKGDPSRRCGSRCRPDVVLFDEAAPRYAELYRALRHQRHADAFVVIGTQGLVLPITQMARTVRGLRILNNLHASDAIDATAFDVVLAEPAGTAWPRIRALLDAWRAAPGHLPSGRERPGHLHGRGRDG